MTEREFLKLRHPDAHLTDVLEDRDGFLLVVDTGGWFRIGCPSSLMAKPDVAGAIFRIRNAGAMKEAKPWGEQTAKIWALARMTNSQSTKVLVAFLSDREPSLARAAAAVASRHKDWMPTVTDHFSTRLKNTRLSTDSLEFLETAARPWLGESSVRELVSALAESGDAERQRTAWRLLAAGQKLTVEPRWLPPLKEALAHVTAGDLPLVLAAAGSLRAPELNSSLKQIVDTLSRRDIASMQPLPTSLMPNGLERAMTEQDLLDLVAYLRSSK